MRIAIDISQIAYEGTGVANYTREMVRYLLKVDTKNEYLLFGYSLRKQDVFKNYLNTIKYLSDKVTFRIIPLPQTLINYLWNNLHIVSLEKFLGKIDVLHSSDWVQPPSTAAKITTVHDLVVYKYPQYSHPYIIKTQKRRLVWVKKECQMILADSRATKTDLIDILRIEPSKIEVVYPGINEQYFKLTDAQIELVRQKYRLSDYILTVGTQEPRKNLEMTLLAFEKLIKSSLIVQNCRKLELVIVGKRGWGIKIKPSKSIRILKDVKDEDLPGLYGGASLFVYPSFYEGFGLPVVEAYACGCPVVTSDRGSLRELGEGVALIVDPTSQEGLQIAMTKIIIDRKLRKELIKKGREKSKEFSWTKSSSQILNLYKMLYDNRN